ncbi:hypothetical protein NLU13_0381 [Sarocladium strictum]|uniref:Pre-mRNA-splicing factor 38B n=1 Tax=Sarocladium strictum TaxID=5046 RepID=A0AA39GNY3_SARSR|nr:hypothetical protein NLU13_0381 [Sarocladium strictum]
MGNDDLLTDDYVADLLAKEANDCSLKYSALGMEAFRTDKKPTNMPKPNTRFLRHIIKNTDSHNKALLAKEAAESKARLGDLEQAAEVKKQKLNPDSKTIRRRQMGDIHAILGGKKRSDRSEARSERRHDGDRPSSSTHRRDREGSNRSKRDLFDGRESDGKDRGRLSKDSRDKDKRRPHERRRRDDASDDDGRKSSRRHRSRSRSRSRSPRHRSDRQEKARSRRHRSPVEHRRSPPRRESQQRTEEDDDSDPLEGLIGPLPAPKYRGRGTVAGSSGIDRRFSESYDPKADVDIDEAVAGESNWDDAVEAFRDRQKLRQAQEERLRSAGFGDEQIQRINDSQKGNGLEESNVRWSKAGEKREWDKGKDVGKQPSGLFSEFSDEEG